MSESSLTEAASATAIAVAGPPPAARRPLPELLAPAGDWDCAKAAVENGADAIYFGLERFNARIRAKNFTEAELPRLMEFLHLRGVRGYVSFNILVFADELAAAEQLLRGVIAAGVDAALVQDVGLARVIRELSPDFPIHASTQMSITSPAGVRFAAALGCSRVVLARELSLKEIGKLQPSSVPLEVFVHGALCVAYSGQCLTSEALGGRSANRGECAQACRMPYELLADGHVVPLGDRRYLLSPQDLAGLEVLPELVEAGVAAVKIEGRLKTPEYVANITRIYRQVLDALAQDRPPPALPPQAGGPGVGARRSSLVSGADQYDMEMAFSRGLSTGWLGGINNQQLVHARFGKKRGVYLGEVTRVQDETVFLRLQGPLKPGDGVVFDAGRPDQPEEGGRVYHLAARGGETALAFGRGDLDFLRIHPGDKLWKTSDPELDRRIRSSFAGDQPRFQRPVTAEVHGRAGSPLTLILRDEMGHVVQSVSAMPLAAAEKQPLSSHRLAEQLGRLGGTPFRLARLDNHLEGPVLLPVSELNRLRRDAVARLQARRAQPPRWTRAPSSPPPSPPRLTSAPPARLIVLVRTLAQLDAALPCGVPTLYCEFEDPKQYREAVQRVRRLPAAGALRSASSAGEPPAPRTGTCPPEIFVAPPRITKPGEDWILNQVRSCGADGYLARNYDHLSFFAGSRCVGDFSLNVANQHAAAWFKDRYGLERLTASYDLNHAQLEALLSAAPPEWFEITIHQHMPLFHMDHCLFCAFLTTGTDFTNCGRPCDYREVKLRDRVGAEHPVKADAGCRNTVYNALAQTGAEYVAQFMALGARHFRVEFVSETPEQVTRTIGQYARLLRGEITGAQLWRELKLHHQLGVTRGPMERAERPLCAL